MLQQTHRPNRLRRAGVTALAALVLSTPALSRSTAAATTMEEEPAKLALVLDASGSMADADPGGGSKMAAAKRALGSLVDTLPDDSVVGLRVYGANDLAKPAGCRDTQLVLPVGPLDRQAAKSAIAEFAPAGWTPIAHSLRAAAADLGSTGQRTIVLVSDGEDTCDPDPCAAAREIAKSGVDLRVDAVGFAVETKARGQLRCIARETGGTYYDAPDAKALTAQLDQLATRALRPYRPTGEPVQGSADVQSAPVLAPGQYLDELRVDEVRYYAVDLADGVTPTFAATVVRGLDEARDTYQFDTLTLGLQTANGQDCGENQELSAPSRANVPQSGHAIPGQVGEEFGSTFDRHEDCGLPGRYILRIERGSNRVDRAVLPVELLFVAEPPVSVSEQESLPSPVSKAAAEPANVPQFRSGGSSATGGGSFTDAGEVGTGSWNDSIRGGESLFYRVRLDWGQRLAYTAVVGRPDGSGSGVITPVSTEIYNPAHVPVKPAGSKYNSVIAGRSPAELANSTVPVIFRNREISDDALEPVSLAGDYFIRVTLGEDEDLGDQALPVRLAVQVVGEVDGAPTYAALPEGDPEEPVEEPTVDPAQTLEPTPATSDPVASEPAETASEAPLRAEPASSSSDLGRTLLFTAGGLAALAGAAALVLLPLLRGRRRS